MRESVVISLESSLLKELIELSQKERLDLSRLISIILHDFIQKRKNPKMDINEFVIPKTGIVLEEFEDRLVREALRMEGGNQSSAAKLLGLTRAKFRVLHKRLSDDFTLSSE